YRLDGQEGKNGYNKRGQMVRIGAGVWALLEERIAMAQYARIFAALDGASTQEAVAERAIALAADNGASLLFGHVVDSAPVEPDGLDYEALCSEGVARIEAALVDLLRCARKNDAIPSVEVRVAAGRAAETLSGQLIDPFSPDLVVCGERGLSNIKYAFVGSVSTYLIRHLRCDVLVVKQG
ncbi:MAG: universal stress protein, partial [Gordonibacter sp.]|uniref:universal stress protein n=1 Tax=Gordonibacter sp. TaxID=1968902 RepID=UPI00321FF5A0